MTGPPDRPRTGANGARAGGGDRRPAGLARRRPGGSSTTAGAGQAPRRWPTAGRPASPSSTCSAPGRSGRSSCGSTRGSSSPGPRPSRWSRWRWASWPVWTAGADRRRPVDRTASGVCVDLGTGSGAIALSLATEGGAVCPGLEVWATDVSPDALAWPARTSTPGRHRSGRRPERVRLAEGSWFDALPAELVGQVDLVVSNPPYVAESEFPASTRRCGTGSRGGPGGARRHGGVAGMAAIEAIVAEAPGWLRPPGVLVVEIAPVQAAAAVAAARRAGFDRGPTDATWPGGSGCWWPGGDRGPCRPSPPARPPSAAAVEALLAGSVVAVPTDTVYGLAVDPSRPGGGGAAVLAEGAAGRRAASGAGRARDAGRPGGRTSGRGRAPTWPTGSGPAP